MSGLRVRLFLATVFMLLLSILPLPAFFLSLRPPFVLLLILYIEFFLPDYFHVGLLFLLGLLLDVLLSTVLGEHAFALSFVAWIASSKARRFRLFTIGQQMALIGFFCLTYQLVIWMVDSFSGYSIGLMVPLGSTVISILVWPWVKLLADETLLRLAFRR
ncbi:MAG: rod shape-determining protein MreD [Tatlockia sp.]|jgi:rod shape-determining protein MreD